MAQVAFERVSKIYPDGTRAVNDVNLDIQDGEFMVLVGWLCDRGGTELAFAVGGTSAIVATVLGAIAIKRPRRPSLRPVQTEPATERLAA